MFWEAKYGMFSLNLQLLALAGFCQIMKALKFMGLYIRFGVITKTILVAIPGVMVQVLMFAIYFSAFGLMGYLTFGPESRDFRAIPYVLETMFMMTIGVFDYQALKVVSPVFGPIFFMLFQGLIFFILLNIFIGIICDAFCECLEEKGDLSFVNEVPTPSLRECSLPGLHLVFWFAGWG